MAIRTRVGSLVLLVCVFQVQAHAQVGKFQGLEWGTDISELPEMKFHHGIGENMKWYTWTKEYTVRFGEANLEYLLYGFYKGRFYEVRMNAKEGENILMKNAALAKYGNAESGALAMLHPTHLRWSTKSETIKVSLDVKEGLLTIKYTPISKETRKDYDELYESLTKHRPVVIERLKAEIEKLRYKISSSRDKLRYGGYVQDRGLLEFIISESERDLAKAESQLEKELRD
ncbi:MAG: hypothetical protein WCO26_21140 [Deltaproteobacteria bacterium]